MSRKFGQAEKKGINSFLLIGESEEQFDRLRDAIKEELVPRGAIEQMYTDDIIYLAWDISRLRQCKAAVINAAFLPALEHLLKMMEVPEFKEIALQWFSNSGTRKDILVGLNEIGLDESAIQAEAIRRSSDEIEKLERMLASLEWRKNKALAFLADVRDQLGSHLRRSSDKVIEGQKVLRLENTRARSR